MKCRAVQRMLSAYLDNELSIVRRASVDEHIAVCSACAAELRLLRSDHADLLHLGLPPVAGDFTARVWAEIRRDTPVKSAWTRVLERIIPVPIVLAGCIVILSGFMMFSPVLYGVQDDRLPEKVLRVAAGAFGTSVFGPSNFARFCDCCHEMLCPACRQGTVCHCCPDNSRREP